MTPVILIISINHSEYFLCLYFRTLDNTNVVLSIGLSSSDVDYLKSANNLGELDMAAENMDVDMMVVTCSHSKNSTLEGNFSPQNNDQFVHLMSQGTLVEVSKAELHDMVCNPVTASISANTTNTITNCTSSLLSRVAEMKLVDAQIYNQTTNTPQTCSQVDVDSLNVTGPPGALLFDVKPEIAQEKSL